MFQIVLQQTDRNDISVATVDSSNELYRRGVATLKAYAPPESCCRPIDVKVFERDL